MTTLLDIVLRTGDVDPITYGGGVVVKTSTGLDWWFWDEPEGDPEEPATEFTIYRTPVPEDVVKTLDWVDWSQVASFIGSEPTEVAKMGQDALHLRVGILDSVRYFYGAHNLDQYPIKKTQEKLCSFLGL
jgi:hypothetical protein